MTSRLTLFCGRVGPRSLLGLLVALLLVWGLCASPAHAQDGDQWVDAAPAAPAEPAPEAAPEALPVAPVVPVDGASEAVRFRFLSNDVPPNMMLRGALAFLVFVICWGMFSVMIHRPLLERNWNPASSTALSISLTGVVTTGAVFVLMSRVTAGDFVGGSLVPWWQDLTDWAIAGAVGGLCLALGVFVLLMFRRSSGAQIEQA